jgi:cyclophilin family peptidyl-prolyl cis-trans isomerase
MMRISAYLMILVLTLILAAGCNGKDTTEPQEKKPAQEKPKVEQPEKKKAPEPVKVDYPVVVMKTSKGDIKIRLNRKKAPVTVDNFLKYVDDKFYDGTVFHRVISNFMIQGGGFTKDLYSNAGTQPRPTRPAIKNEAKNGLSNKRGTIAMARGTPKNSATSQFFINVADNRRLNYRGEMDGTYGYAVFGEVIEGMGVVDKIKNVLTTKVGQLSDVPADPVVIKSVRRVKE